MEERYERLLWEAQGDIRPGRGSYMDMIFSLRMITEICLAVEQANQKNNQQTNQKVFLCFFGLGKGVCKSEIIGNTTLKQCERTIVADCYVISI